MRYFFTIFIFTSISVAGFSQNSTDPIYTEEKFGTIFIQNGQHLNPKKLKRALQYDEEAFAVLKKARGNYGFATVLSFAGGFLIGWPIGTAIGGGDPNWVLAGIGGGLLLATIPLAIAYDKGAKRAVTIYNKNLSQVSGLRLTTSEYGLSLVFPLSP